MATRFTEAPIIEAKDLTVAIDAGPELDIRENIYTTLQIVQKSGNITGSVIIIECSATGGAAQAEWHPLTGASISGAGITDGNLTSACFIRWRRTAVSSVACTADIYLQAK